MFINGLGTALPATRYTQAECWKGLEGWNHVKQLSPRSRALLRKVLLADNGIATRHFAIHSVEEAYALTPDAMHDRFARHAPELAAEAGRNALDSARLRPEENDAVIVSTC